jgi:hypothetical protein
LLPFDSNSKTFYLTDTYLESSFPFFNLQNLSDMVITYDELRDIKHKLPTGSVKKIAEALNIEEQTVRNYFGAHKYENGDVVSTHIQPGPGGGIVHLEDTTIYEMAMKILAEAQGGKTDN